MTYGLITSMTPAQLWAHVEHTQNRPKPGLYPFLLIFPSLRYLPDWFPGAGFWKTGRKYHEEDRKVWLDLMADMKRIQVGRPYSRKHCRKGMVKHLTLTGR